jgi:hypothetical protein
MPLQMQLGAASHRRSSAIPKASKQTRNICIRTAPRSTALSRRRRGLGHARYLDR